MLKPSPALFVLSLSMLCLAPATRAETPADMLATLQQQAAAETPRFAGFDAGRGEQFFKTKHSDWSCASCHTEDPRQPGKHAKTDKPIDPLAPTANAKRFTDPKKVAKWFKRNCGDVLGRECSAQEKGDVLAYLIGLKP
jgi:mono/diheme cytochrome c family protein